MKIGIVTYHRPYNFGGCLQALATLFTLSKLGHTPYIIDYWPRYHKAQYSLFSLRRFCGMPTIKEALFYLCNCIVNLKTNRERHKVFKSFIDREIMPNTKTDSESFDVIIYGSDQIWRKQPGMNKYNPVYFGCNQFKTSKHVAFSASMGVLPSNPSEDILLKDYISHLSRLSVRELDLKRYVENLGFNDVKLTLDPTLLLSMEDWNKIIQPNEFLGRKYILVYALNECFDYQHIKNFAQSKDLDIKYLDGNSMCVTNQTYRQIVGPDIFLDLIRNADYVFSSSFHGLAFSIIFHKEFFVSFETNYMRAVTLLDNCGLSNRFLPPNSPIPTAYGTIDYDVVDCKLQDLKTDTINFLKSL